MNPNDPLEAFDVLSEGGVPTGRVKAREDVHRDGDWHGAVHVWLHDGEGRVLMQRRAEAKDLSPGKLDVAVGGHLTAGETAWDALREVEEELGFTIPAHGVTHLGRFASVRTYEDATDREYQDVFAARLPVPVSEIVFDTREVAAVQLVPLQDVIGLVEFFRPVNVHAYMSRGVALPVTLEAHDVIQEGREGMLRELRTVATHLDTRVDSKVAL